jgi:hypothetical protein
METKEKESLRVLPTRSQLLALRMAAGITPAHGNRRSSDPGLRNHLVVPADHANPLLEASSALEGLGALTTSPKDVGMADVIARGEDVTFYLTPIGAEMVRPLGALNHPLGLEHTLEGTDSPRSRAIEHLLAAQTHLLEARSAIEQSDSPLPHVPQIVSFLGALTMFLGLVGEAVYQLRHPVGRSGLRG